MFCLFHQEERSSLEINQEPHEGTTFVAPGLLDHPATALVLSGTGQRGELTSYWRFGGWSCVPLLERDCEATAKQHRHRNPENDETLRKSRPSIHATPEKFSSRSSKAPRGFGFAHSPRRSLTCFLFGPPG